ncbi:L-lactate transport [Methylocella silvestris BL2]|uniref:L-lactate permease n=1 Tax=Methylocella silvestris (strain DSM 15510 / CIP 108128 / LMG 27833 / NCIMB 13906 / BL2) TaxID=395965 RepID=B8EKI7_METSB|nr:L-lactate permease [Methylocella silvestris]ACK51357.1 L-lactate transport [Methylocella silvestris BL2]
MWRQVYDPFGNGLFSTLVACLPIVTLLGLIAFTKTKAHIAALIALAVAFIVAVFAFTMPAPMAIRASLLGAVTGLFPIGWIVLNVIFLHRLTVENGSFAVLQRSIAGITSDRRLQLLLVAFCFGAFFEGAAGFGTPVAVTGAILIGLGFSPLAASGLSLIANTAPVAYGALGTPIVVLGQVTGLDPVALGAMAGRQLPFFSVLVPFWLIIVFAGWKGALQIWPAVLVAGVTFAVPQFLVSNFHGPWLVDVIAALVSMGSLALFLKFWQPAQIWTNPSLVGRVDHSAAHSVLSAPEAPPTILAHGGESDLALASESKFAPGDLSRPHIADDRSVVIKAWTPWIILCVFVFIWGTESFKKPINALWLPKFEVAGLHDLVTKVPPVVPKETIEHAVFSFNILTMTGTAILLAAIVSGFVMGYSPLQLVKSYWRTLGVVRNSLITIAAMLALGTLTRFSGLDATLGLTFAQTGFLYPFFGALLGWLGVALTGSDTASNVLFGGLQTVSARQLGLSPILMAATNSSGGVMGKMIDAQSIVVASTATNWFGHEGSILRFVFPHSIVLACLVGLLVMLQAYVYPFTQMVIH